MEMEAGMTAPKRRVDHGRPGRGGRVVRPSRGNVPEAVCRARGSTFLPSGGARPRTLRRAGVRAPAPGIVNEEGRP